MYINLTILSQNNAIFVFKVHVTCIFGDFLIMTFKRSAEIILLMLNLATYTSFMENGVKCAAVWLVPFEQL